MSSLSFIIDSEEESGAHANKKLKVPGTPADLAHQQSSSSSALLSSSHVSSVGQREDNIDKTSRASVAAGAQGRRRQTAAAAAGTSSSSSSTTTRGSRSAFASSSSTASAATAAAAAVTSARRRSTTSNDSMDHPGYGSGPPSSMGGSGLNPPNQPMRPMRAPGPSELPIKLTPITGRVSRAKKGVPVHTCDQCKPPKTFTRAEHLRRHQLSHQTPGYACTYPGCDRAFHRPDLLARHQQRHEQEGDKASSRGGQGDSRRTSSASQRSMEERIPRMGMAGSMVGSPSIPPAPGTSSTPSISNADLPSTPSQAGSTNFHNMNSPSRGSNQSMSPHPMAAGPGNYPGSARPSQDYGYTLSPGTVLNPEQSMGASMSTSNFHDSFHQVAHRTSQPRAVVMQNVQLPSLSIPEAAPGLYQAHDWPSSASDSTYSTPASDISRNRSYWVARRNTPEWQHSNHLLSPYPNTIPRDMHSPGPGLDTMSAVSSPPYFVNPFSTATAPPSHNYGTIHLDVPMSNFTPADVPSNHPNLMSPSSDSTYRPHHSHSISAPSVRSPTPPPNSSAHSTETLVTPSPALPDPLSALANLARQKDLMGQVAVSQPGGTHAGLGVIGAYGHHGGGGFGSPDEAHGGGGGGLLAGLDLAMGGCGMPGVGMTIPLARTVRNAVPGYLEAYWDKFHSSFPLVHRRSVEASGGDDVLRCSMAGMATQYLDSKEDRMRGSQLHEFAWQEVKRYPQWNLQTMQAILLCEFFARFRGRKAVTRPSKVFENLYSRVSESQFFSSRLEDVQVIASWNNNNAACTSVSTLLPGSEDFPSPESSPPPVPPPPSAASASAAAAAASPSSSATAATMSPVLARSSAVFEGGFALRSAKTFPTATFPTPSASPMSRSHSHSRSRSSHQHHYQQQQQQQQRYRHHPYSSYAPYSPYSPYSPTTPSSAASLSTPSSASSSSRPTWSALFAPHPPSRQRQQSRSPPRPRRPPPPLFSGSPSVPSVTPSFSSSSSTAAATAVRNVVPGGQRSSHSNATPQVLYNNPTMFDHAPLPETHPHMTLEDRWLAWVDIESRRRLLSACFVVDVHTSLYQQQRRAQDPISSDIPSIPLTGHSAALWEARSADEWAAVLAADPDAGSPRFVPHRDILTAQDIAARPSFDRLAILCTEVLRLPRRQSVPVASDEGGLKDMDMDIDPRLPNANVQHQPSPTHQSRGSLMDIHSAPAGGSPQEDRIIALFPGCAMASTFLALHHTPLHDLLAVSGDSWVFSQKVLPATSFQEHQKRLKTWTEAHLHYQHLSGASSVAGSRTHSPAPAAAASVSAASASGAAGAPNVSVSATVAGLGGMSAARATIHAARAILAFLGRENAAGTRAGTGFGGDWNAASTTAPRGGWMLDTSDYWGMYVCALIVWAFGHRVRNGHDAANAQGHIQGQTSVHSAAAGMAGLPGIGVVGMTGLGLGGMNNINSLAGGQVGGLNPNTAGMSHVGGMQGVQPQHRAGPDEEAIDWLRNVAACREADEVSRLRGRREASGVVGLVRKHLEWDCVGGRSRLFVDAVGVLKKLEEGVNWKWF